MSSTRKHIAFAVFLLMLIVSSTLLAQSTGSIQGTITDPTGAALAGATVSVTNQDTQVGRTVTTNQAGGYLVPALPAGNYRIEVRASGFQTQVVTNYVLSVSTTATRNFQLPVGKKEEVITVTGEAPVLESSTISVGTVLNQATVQQVPLNGRHIEDLINMAAGSVVPPANGFLTAPLRGQGSFGANTAGNREDTVNFQVNGINLQDPVQNQTTFQPSINTVSEFKLLNSTFSSEYGHTSGSVMNVATRSGTNSLHGEVFDFVRNEAFDARNFFNTKLTGSGSPNPQAPFKRNNFGAALGGPVFIPGVYDGRNRTFWFFTYEGLRQRQQVVFNRQVFTDAERASVTDPTARALLGIVPRSNQAGGFFTGTGSAPVDIDQYTIDFSHKFGAKDRFHGYYARQHDQRMEPSAPVSASTVPGFGDTREGHRQILTTTESHVFSPNVVNEFRFGGNRIEITFVSNNTQDPSSFGFTGLTSFGLPEISIQSTGLDFAGFSGFPQGREDTTWVVQDTVSWLKGKHNLKFGTEERKVFQNNFNSDMGFFQFTNNANFLAGRPARFNFVPGTVDNAISIAAMQFFVQDSYKVLPNLTLELGYRFEWNTTPTERNNKFVAFDPATSSLRRVGTAGFGQLYGNNFNHQPRVGFSWDPFRHGKFVVRSGYGIFYDQPVTNTVTGLSSNPPFRNPLQINNPPSFANPFLGTAAAAGALSPGSICRCFKNDYVQGWNVNLQQEITPGFGVMIGYFGSKATHLRLSRNLNQPVGPASTANPNGVLPFPRATLPDGTVSNLLVITEIASPGNSNYNALWVTANKRVSHGLQFNASYQWSKALDYNSLNSQGIVLQDSTNPRNNYGPADFDTRHHFGLSYVYDLPFGNAGPKRLVRGWQLAGLLSTQSGNPLRVTLAGSNTGVTNVAGTVRVDLIGNPLVPSPSFAQFLNPLAFARPAGTFGNLRRNSIVGPNFFNWDFSLVKDTAITERVKLEFRSEFFNLLNHPNFSNPVLSCSPSSAGTCNTGSFGQIVSTRGPGGDFGSARQIQFALKLKF